MIPTQRLIVVYRHGTGASSLWSWQIFASWSFAVTSIRYLVPKPPSIVTQTNHYDLTGRYFCWADGSRIRLSQQLRQSGRHRCVLRALHRSGLFHMDPDRRGDWQTTRPASIPNNVHGWMCLVLSSWFDEQPAWRSNPWCLWCWCSPSCRSRCCRR